MTLVQLSVSWPLNAPVKHVQTSRVGTVVLCPEDDALAAELLNGQRAAHAFLRSGKPLVFVDFGDGYPAWYRTHVLRRTGVPGSTTVWHGNPKGRRRWAT